MFSSHSDELLLLYVSILGQLQPSLELALSEPGVVLVGALLANLFKCVT